MKNLKQIVPFLWVTDLQASLDFYISRLGFVKMEEWIDEGKLRWCFIEKDDVAIMLQEFWKEGSHKNITDDKLGVGVGLTFICNDALVIYNELVSNGLKLKEPFVGNHMWVIGLHDPDGYNLVFESNTEIEEGTTYSDWLKQETD